MNEEERNLYEEAQLTERIYLSGLVMDGFDVCEKATLLDYCVRDEKGCLNYMSEWVILHGQHFVPRRLAWMMGRGCLSHTDYVALVCKNVHCCNAEHMYLVQETVEQQDFHVERRDFHTWGEDA